MVCVTHILERSHWETSQSTCIKLHTFGKWLHWKSTKKEHTLIIGYYGGHWHRTWTVISSSEGHNSERKRTGVKLFQIMFVKSFTTAAKYWNLAAVFCCTSAQLSTKQTVWSTASTQKVWQHGAVFYLAAVQCVAITTAALVVWWWDDVSGSDVCYLSAVRSNFSTTCSPLTDRGSRCCFTRCLFSPKWQPPHKSDV